MFDILHTALLTAVTILNLKPDMTIPQVVESAVCVAAYAEQYRQPPFLIVAVIQHETQWRPNCISRSDDYGLGQIHCPSRYCQRKPTKEEVERLLDPCENIKMVAEFLSMNGIHRYNPGSPTHAVSVKRLERRFTRFWEISKSPWRLASRD